MQVPLDDALAQLPLSDELKDGLLDKPGKCRDLLTLCLEYEKGKWSEVSALAESLGVSEEIIKNKYLASVEFVNGIWAELTNPVYA